MEKKPADIMRHGQYIPKRFTIIGKRVAYKFEGVPGYFFRGAGENGMTYWTRPWPLIDGTPDPVDFNSKSL